MKRVYTSSFLTLAAAAMFALVGTQGAGAQQGAVIKAVATFEECPEMAYEMAYETPREFVGWLLAREDRIKLIDVAERQDMLALIKEIAWLSKAEDGSQTGE